MSQIYLGKSGRAFGPYTEGEVEKLQKSGELASFHWIWDETSRVWQPMDPPPAPLITKAGISKAPLSTSLPSTPEQEYEPAPEPVRAEPARRAPAPRTPAPEAHEVPVAASVYAPPEVATVIPIQSKAAPKQKASTKPFSEKNYQAICHNQDRVVSGHLRQFGETEGELLSEMDSSGPELATPSSVLVNLLDTKTGKSLSIQAQVAAVQRRPEGWSYQLQWNQALKWA